MALKEKLKKATILFVVTDLMFIKHRLHSILQE